MTQRLTIGPLAHSRQGSAAVVLTSVRSWPSEAARKWALNAAWHWKRSTDIQAVTATGSAVRDVEHSDDLDLVIVYQTRRPELPRPPIDVDLRLYEDAEVLRKLERGHDYLSWTVRYGRVLFERERWWTRLTSDWQQRLSLPSVAEAQERADKACRIYNDLLEIGDHDAATEFIISMLTFLARGALSSAGVFPKSRPELAEQLRSIDDHGLSDRLSSAIAHRYG